MLGELGNKWAATPTDWSGWPVSREKIKSGTFVRGMLFRARIFKLLRRAKNQFQGTNSARLCSLAGRYDNSIRTRFLAPKGCLKIPAQENNFKPPNTGTPGLNLATVQQFAEIRIAS